MRARYSTQTSTDLVQTHDHLFWELIEQERHHTWRLCRALTRNYDDACDLLSDTMLGAFHSFPSLRDTRAFRKFLSTIAVRLHRRKQWRGRLFAPLEAAAEVYDESTRESSHDLEVLIHALDKLPAKEREALVLFELSELSIKEIQEIQGGTASGVKSRMSRARVRLKEMLADRAPLVRFAPESFGEPAAKELAPSFRWQGA